MTRKGRKENFVLNTNISPLHPSLFIFSGTLGWADTSRGCMPLCPNKFNTEDAKEAQRARRGSFELPRQRLSHSEKTCSAPLFVYPFALRRCLKCFNAGPQRMWKGSKRMSKTRQKALYFKLTFSPKPQRPLRLLCVLCVKKETPFSNLLWLVHRYFLRRRVNCFLQQQNHHLHLFSFCEASMLAHPLISFKYGRYKI